MTDDHDEPTPVGDAIPAWLRRRAEDLGVSPVDSGPHERTETPQEREERRLRAAEGVRARWLRRLPPMYADATGADLDPPLVIPPGTRNIALAGPVGTGKTHAAYAIGNDLVTHGHQSCEAWTVVDLLEALRPTKPGADPDEQRQANYWTRRADVLILDDLGSTKVSEWAVETMVAILDHRLREERVTVATTNMTEAQLEEAWGGRLLDRLRFRRVVHVLRGESRRVGAW